MTNKTITIYASEIKQYSRLEPRFYYNQSLLRKTFDKFGYEEIKDFATLKSGSTPEHYENRKTEEDCYFVESADIKRYSLNLSTVSFVSNEIHKSRTKLKIIPNDVLLSSAGSIGTVCIVPQKLKEGSTNQAVIRIRLKERNLTKFNPHFLVAFLNSQFSQIQIESFITSTNQRYLNMRNFGNYKIPKIDEQTIEKVSLKIQKAEKNEIEASLLLEKSQKLFYQKLSIDFSKIKKENFYSVNVSDFLKADLWSPKYLYPLYVNTLKAIQKKWKTVLLGEIAITKKGNEVGSENYNLHLGKGQNDIPFIRTSDFVNYEVDQFPDFFISEGIFSELNQDIKVGDMLFTKDGKIGMTAMITKNDRVIISSGISRLRLKDEAKKYNLTPEYLFLILSLKETGLYPSIRRTVIASTLPHLREERLKEIEIPVLDKSSIGKITKLVKRAFELKDEKKGLIKEAQKQIDDYFQI
ncbi:7005_t:CDS:1 [Gigaspora margarita]|uniref:7005_t:CDS:1 n=1 Tax=Gigaspora margarita TaxID=4874 RepID=A0ABN7WGE5_GIGMA|nr:7005_t:CDS:1 [Gigaspora margarita]